MRSVRRLAAVDMWGTKGTTRRRRIVVAEFLLGVLGCGALGALSVVHGAGIGWWIGVWLLGVAVNYVPLAAHAVSLSRPGALDKELAGVDIQAELRRYGRWQLIIAVPVAVAIAAIIRPRTRAG